MDMELIRRMATRATEECRHEIGAIEEGLSPCFKTSPGRKLSKRRCGELRAVLDRLEQEEKAALQR